MLKEFFAREGKVCMLVALRPSNEERLCGWYVGGATSKQKHWRQIQNNRENSISPKLLNCDSFFKEDKCLRISK